MVPGALWMDNEKARAGFKHAPTLAGRLDVEYRLSSHNVFAVPGHAIPSQRSPLPEMQLRHRRALKRSAVKTWRARSEPLHHRDPPR